MIVMSSYNFTAIMLIHSQKSRDFKEKLLNTAILIEIEETAGGWVNTPCGVSSCPTHVLDKINLLLNVINQWLGLDTNILVRF